MTGNLRQGQVLYEFESYCLDPVQGVLTHGDELVRLAPKAFEILLVLVERRQACRQEGPPGACLARHFRRGKQSYTEHLDPAESS